MVIETSTTDSPWFVIPADRKWYRDLVITQILVETLDDIAHDVYPPNPELEGLIIE